jgi:two-component system, OmpR family, copper resistance phosphate regulon response regulator CusR
LSGIPKRLVQGLLGHEELVSLCQELGALAER